MITTAPHATSVEQGLAGYRAQCACGWLGPWTISMTESAIAAEMHEADPASAPPDTDR